MANKFKKKTGMVIKKHEGETYLFRNGVAKVPGCKFQGQVMTITLEEFKEMTEE